jgi:hypothetical protein
MFYIRNINIVIKEHSLMAKLEPSVLTFSVQI